MNEVSQDSWEGLRQSVDDLQRWVNQVRATHVNTKAIKESAKALVQSYFRVVRPDLEALGVDQELLDGVDLQMQALLGLANSRNRKSTYVSVLRDLRVLCDDVEFARERGLGRARAIGISGQTSVEGQIVRTLEQLVPSAALSYQQALKDLQDPQRLSFRGTANELREALRETLDHLAPDRDVEGADGFKLGKGRTKPTQKQKVHHILRSRGLGRTARQTPESAVTLIDELTASVTRASFERGSLSAHIASSGKEVRQLKMYVDSVLAEMLEVHA